MVGGTSYVHRDSFQNKTNADVGREIDDRLLGHTRAESKKSRLVGREENEWWHSVCM